MGNQGGKGRQECEEGSCIEHGLFRGLRHSDLVEQQDGREDNTKNPKTAEKPWIMTDLQCL